MTSNRDIWSLLIDDSEEAARLREKSSLMVKASAKLKERGITTPRELAESLDIPYAQANHLIKGDLGRVTTDTIATVCHAIDVKVSFDLVPEEEENA